MGGSINTTSMWGCHGQGAMTAASSWELADGVLSHNTEPNVSVAQYGRLVHNGELAAASVVWIDAENISICV